ncbi:MAG: hypothetical protein RL693_73 [Verrucomicrobiota bacterium]
MKVKLHSQTHEWRQRDDDNNLRYLRACWDSIKWHFFYTTKTMEDWAELPNPTLEDYEGLRDVLFRKYQRKRLPWKFVVDIDKFLEEMKGEQGGQSE